MITWSNLLVFLILMINMAMTVIIVLVMIMIHGDCVIKKSNEMSI